MADDNAGAEVPKGHRDVDLTAEAPPLAVSYSPLTRPYDPRPAREKVRGRIALLLLALLAGTILLTFATLWFGIFDASAAKELLAVLLAPLVGLVGAATGFYYGGKTD